MRIAFLNFYVALCGMIVFSWWRYNNIILDLLINVYYYCVRRTRSTDTGKWPFIRALHGSGLVQSCTLYGNAMLIANNIIIRQLHIATRSGRTGPENLRLKMGRAPSPRVQAAIERPAIYLRTDSSRICRGKTTESVHCTIHLFIHYTSHRTHWYKSIKHRLAHVCACITGL